MTFIEVRRGRAGESMEVEPGAATGDFLQGFLRGTRTALYEGGRDSMTLSIPEVNARTVGALIALYDRAVGFYGSLVGINAYHQPGVEAGKKAAAGVLATLAKVKGALGADAQTAEEMAAALGEDAEAVWHALTHLAANDAGVGVVAGARAREDAFARG